MTALLAIVALQTPWHGWTQNRPTVMRAAFDNRPGMLLIGPPGGGAGLWFAFNPSNCSEHQVWLGELERRGKVFDFSQNNSRAKGRMLASYDDDLLLLPDSGAPAPGWDSQGASPKKGFWTFDTSGASLTSPSIDLSIAQVAYVAFDERSDKGRLHFDVLGDASQPPEWFESSKSIEGDNVWQWNFHAIRSRAKQAQIRISQQDVKFAKALRNFRVLIDPAVWVNHGPFAKYMGYRIDPKTKRVTVMITIGDQGYRWSPEPTTDGWRETLTVEGPSSAPGIVPKDWPHVKEGVKITSQFGGNPSVRQCQVEVQR